MTAKLQSYQGSCYEAFIEISFLFCLNSTIFPVLIQIPSLRWFPLYQSWAGPRAHPHTACLQTPVLPFGGSWLEVCCFLSTSELRNSRSRAVAFYMLFFSFFPQTGARLWLQLAGSVHTLLWVSLGQDTDSFPCSQGWALCLLTVDAGLCKLPTAGSYFLMIL